MKKMLMGVMLSTVLLSGTIGGVKANAAEVDNGSNVGIELLEVRDSDQTKSVINGVYYRFSLVTGKNYPPYKARGATRVYVTKSSNGAYTGYYR